MGQITVFSGPERRRRWSDEDRLRILTEAFAPGACVAEVARRHDVSTALVYTWRRKLREAHAEPALEGLATPGPPVIAQVRMVFCMVLALNYAEECAGISGYRAPNRRQPSSTRNPKTKASGMPGVGPGLNMYWISGCTVSHSARCAR
jgi:transposase-like protein